MVVFMEKQTFKEQVESGEGESFDIDPNLQMLVEEFLPKSFS